ncbi:MAG: crosslink repair DNA glycosylase YcaQ family protein [Ardenticatenaceae bacterium]|nr:crosslink repair DNA glycosylase YcaQ family protein [Ardenticatenaceae bacterium]
MTKSIQLTPTEARRLAISAQQLTHSNHPASKEALYKTMQKIRCLQLDPIRAVERTQYLVLWSRLGQYNRQWLHDLVAEQLIFEYWAHAASIVLTEDFPLHEHHMRRYAASPKSSWAKRLNKWVHDNPEFKAYILSELDRRGPLLTNQFENQSKVPWESGGWSSGRSVAFMLDYLWTSGEILVAKRDGLKRWWDLASRVLPLESLDSGWSSEAVTADAAQKALRSLGVGRLADIKKHFIEGRYPGIEAILPQLATEKQILPVEIDGWPGEWFLTPDQLPHLEAIRSDNWRGKTALLSPFDNLIRDRNRTELMWDFYYRIEIYVPKAKREFGYYVLPILHHDQLIGRIDPKMDYKKKILTIHNVYAQNDAPKDGQTAAAIGETIADLGRFLGAEQIVYDKRPAFWKLRSHDLTTAETRNQ